MDTYIEGYSPTTLGTNYTTVLDYAFKVKLFPEMKYDPEAEAVYVTVKQGKVAKTIEYTDLLIADYDENGDLLGVEILNVKA